MKAESNVKPVAQFEILPYKGDDVEILFYENVETLPPAEDREVEAEAEAEKYSYDYYRLIIRNRQNLEVTIETSFDAWLALAKEKEAKESIQIPTPEGRLIILEDTMNFILGL